MRVTVLDDDPGERIIPGRERITVYLDGVMVSRCFTADDVKGEVVVAEADGHGRVLSVNGEVKRRIRHGQVRIERCPR
ncbi:hypothetical protein [Phytobacter sp. SCO41]|uniref:hypothetical protein n=1 Tax=Phytobacter sp. SCO41 TaxID=1756993 RepID=UPI000D4FFF8E|nr:hypothetical protein [Phytobacter sp. SCO41]